MLLKSLARRLLPRPARKVLAQSFYRTAVHVDATLHKNDELVPPKILQSVGGGDFTAIGNEYLEYFRTFGHLSPDDRVLDVGCGIGRMAVPLTRFLSPNGSYEGFDVVAHGVQWCRQRITPRYPNFRFRCVSVRNDDYNPSGAVSALSFRFPYQDESFDFVFLTSVFTHMIPADAEHYVGEIARVLRPGGRVFGTWFLLNEESRRLVSEGRSTLRFAHTIEGGMTIDREVLGQAVSIDEAQVRGWHAHGSLAIEDPIHYGNWCGRAKFLTYQDVLVARKGRG